MARRGVPTYPITGRQQSTIDITYSLIQGISRIHHRRCFSTYNRDNTALNAWRNLSNLKSKRDVISVALRNTMPRFDDASSPSNYISKHRALNTLTMAADPMHYLATLPPLILEILSGLPSTLHAKFIRSQYEQLSTTNQTHDAVNELCNLILELPHKARSAKTRRTTSTRK